jgi:hypothetical protein
MVSPSLVRREIMQQKCRQGIAQERYGERKVPMKGDAAGAQIVKLGWEEIMGK